jgi:hypothetical protein
MGGTKRFYEHMESKPSSNITRKEYNELKKRVFQLESIIHKLYQTQLV